MDRKICLLMALGLAASSALAQGSEPRHQLQPGHQSQSLSSGQPGAMHSEGTSQPQAGSASRPQSSGAAGMGAANSASGARLDARLLPAPAEMNQLAAQSQDGVTWLCGGIGESEEAYMKGEASKYDMMLTFAARNGAYMADVSVDIVDNRGNSVLRTTCGGPLMLVDLPKDGSYRVRAEAGGHTVTRTARVQNGKGQSRNVVMTWPLSVAGIEEDEPSSSAGASGAESSGRGDSGR